MEINKEKIIEIRIKLDLISAIYRKGYEEVLSHTYGEEHDYIKTLKGKSSEYLNEEKLKLRKIIGLI